MKIKIDTIELNEWDGVSIAHIQGMLASVVKHSGLTSDLITVEVDDTGDREYGSKMILEFYRQATAEEEYAANKAKEERQARAKEERRKQYELLRKEFDTELLQKIKASELSMSTGFDLKPKGGDIIW